MTVAATTRRAGPFAGNGVATSFPFAFKVFAASDVGVVLTASTGAATTLTLNSDYGVLLNPDQDANPGGTVTYPLFIGPPVLPTGSTLTMIGSLPANQTTDLTNSGRFLPQVIENVFDKLTILIQQLLEVSDRTLQAAVGTTVKLVFPAPSSGKFIRWRTDLTGLENADAGTDSMVLQGLLADAADVTHGGSLIGYRPNEVGAPIGRTLANKLRDILSVKDFGAIGNGVADDTAAIQACVNAAGNRTDGGVVIFPDGLYKISASITIAKNYVTLEGSSKDGSQVFHTAAFGPMFVFINGITVLDGVGIRNLRLIDNGALNNTGIAIQAENVSRFIATGLTIFGGSSGIVLKGAANVTLADIYMYMQNPAGPFLGRYGVRIMSSSLPGVPIPFGSNLQLINVHVYGGDNVAATYANLDACIEVESCDGLWLTGCYFGGAERADMWFTRINPAHTCGNIYIVNTMADICRGNGILINGSEIHQRIHFEGSVSCANTGGAGKDGVYIGGRVDQLVLKGTFEGWKGNGIHFGNTAGLICTNVVVTGCNVTGNAAFGIQLEANTGTQQVAIVGNNLAGNINGAVNDLSLPTSLITFGNNVAYNVPWRGFTPVVTPNGGAITVAATGRYRQIDSIVTVQIKFTVSADTGTGFLTVTLPNGAGTPGNPLDSFAMSASETTGNIACNVRAQSGSAVMVMTKYDGTYPSAVGKAFLITGSYQVP